ncbi:branched-chain-amino-acid transaminase [Peptoniphilus harei ACS-146-V-Sch2b]|uniref:Branched-chain-amino-acid aminotransferase n=1 Tax=Peptoniphilus harei ACS-146-V-Sch2b TaxID=908338 RepID=E4KZM3_9FIRM|nr:branched-chain amino acid transaminase [Peptoniphilus harei]EFR32657.1 branched-chain-amino-acid transaminase [Peptoniphilus harei ACS-146-V-Sch2b]MDU7533043.1 branched-chain amino acid transaminase [Peptoniphilus harei]
MNQSYVFYNGEIVEEEKVSISIRSKVVNYGLGVFEGIRAYWNEEEEQLYAFKLVEHYERFLQSAKVANLKVGYTAEELADYTIELLRKNGFRETTYIRPIAYKDGKTVGISLHGHEDDCVVIYLQPMGKYIDREAFKVKVSSWVRIADNMLPPRTKATAGYLNSALASFEATKNGYDEAVLLNRNGFVCEGPGENIFLYKKGKLMTPPASDDILEGITRDLVMKLAKEELGIECVEKSVARTELYNADEVFFSGTAMEVAPVVEVDDIKVADGKPGKVCLELKKLFADLTHGRNPKYMDSLRPVYEK